MQARECVIDIEAVQYNGSFADTLNRMSPRFRETCRIWHENVAPSRNLEIMNRGSILHVRRTQWIVRYPWPDLAVFSDVEFQYRFQEVAGTCPECGAALLPGESECADCGGAA
jgi:hypothetical protein